MEEQASLSAIVHGRVQGVFFRDFVRGIAELHGLTGWVRNLPEGTVEVRAEGPRDKLLELLKFLELGPPRARVDRVDATWLEYAGDYSSFQVRFL